MKNLEINKLRDAKKDACEASYVRAAIYARYSSQMQKADSIDDQITIIRQMLASKRLESKKWKGIEIKILPEWILWDEAKSGKTAARDNYMRILDGIRSDAFDLLLVDNLSRATRDLGGMMDLYNEIRFYGKELVSASEGLSTEDPMAKTYFAVKGMVNDMENDTRSNCTKRGMIGKYLKGYVCGDAPYGYQTTPTATNEGKGNTKNCNYEVSIDPNKAEVVRRIYKMYASGIGIASVCKILNREGIVWPSFPRGKGWSQTTVLKILTSAKYIGIWIWGTGKYFLNPSSGKKVMRERSQEEWIYFRNRKFNEDLVMVDKDLWDRVQEVRTSIVKARQDATTPQKKLFVRESDHDSSHFLSGALQCAECGGNMIVTSGRRGGYYGCFNAHRKATCSNRSLIRAEKIEKKVMEELLAKLKSDEFIRDLAKNYNRHKNSVIRNTEDREEILGKELTRLRAEVNNLVTFIAAGENSQAVSHAIKGKEIRIKEIELLLRHAGGRRSKGIFVTPSLVKKKLERIQEILGLDHKLAKRIIHGLLAQKIVIRKQTDIPDLKVILDESAFLKEGIEAI